jgi:threonylcarbamoyladenosine tRNA methylthiotransferase MtaB
VNQTVAFHTLGCKLNFAETSAIGLNLKEAGYKKIDFGDGADVVVINTCSVTENADRECRMIVRRALQKNPDSFIAVIGCYAQLKPYEIASIDGVDLVLGATEKFNLAGFLNDVSKKNKAEIHSCTIGDAKTFEPAYSFGDRTRTFLKVQDGCNYPCTYCTIPLARGASRSASIENVIQQANEIASKGSREIVLTGVNIGDYGIYSNPIAKHESDFFELLRNLEKVKGIERFRISSIEPNLLGNDIIDFVSSSSHIAPHFHMPLQSGSDKILRLMKRRYRRDLYAERVKKIKSVLPNACIGVDVIVGFPGETDDDFLETYKFIQEIEVSYLHVFTYSERDDTEAATMTGKIDMAIRKKRNNMLRILSEKKRQEFYRSQLGKTFTVLFEEESHEGYMHGFTENYIRVRYPYQESLINTPLLIKLDKFDGTASADAEILIQEMHA